jgi:hypothetical protein
MCLLAAEANNSKTLNLIEFWNNLAGNEFRTYVAELALQGLFLNQGQTLQQKTCG